MFRAALRPAQRGRGSEGMADAFSYFIIALLDFEALLARAPSSGAVRAALNDRATVALAHARWIF